MFQWAQQQLDKISQTVAPPPTDGAGRFAFCVQRNDEEGAMGCIAEIDPVNTVVNHSKGWYPIHLSCQNSCMRLTRLLLSQPGIQLEQTDMAGNTALHHACMAPASNPNALPCVQMLMKEFGASCLTKNYQGQTPYDVATANSIRQYLLPIQLQAETQMALDNGGQGLPPGIDLGGLRIQNSAMPPPPTGFGAPPQAGQPPSSAYPPTPGLNTSSPYPPTPGLNSSPYPPTPGLPASSPYPATPGLSTGPAAGAPSPAASAPAMSTAPASFTPAPAAQVPAVSAAPAPNSQAAPAPAPASSNNVPVPPRSGSHEYSRVGSSSAQLSTTGKYRADGFHSSSSDVSLQKKYGHSQVQRYVPPPPSSGNSVPSAPGSGNFGGPNPFAAGSAIGNRYGAMPNRYVSYGPGATAPAPASQPLYANYGQASAAPANFTMFIPGGGAAPAPAAPAPYQQAPSSAGYPQQTPASVSYQQPASQQPAPAPYGAKNAAPAPSTPSTPSMPPPPYQTQGYQQPQPTSAAYQKPDFVSPTNATYGSPGTPMESPSTESAPQPTHPNDVFSQPSPQAAPPAAFGAQNASDAFSAPAPAPAQVNPADAFAAPAPAQDNSMSSQPNNTLSNPATADSQASQVFSSQGPPTAANDVFGAPPKENGTVQPGPSQAANGFNANPPQQVDTYAANVFGAPPPKVQTPQKEPEQQPARSFVASSPVSNNSPFASTAETSLFRAKSAEELFGDAPPAEQNLTQPPSAANQEQQPQQNQQQISQTNVLNDAAGLFATPEKQGAQTRAESNTEQTNAANEDDDGLMDDVPLSSPFPVPIAQTPEHPAAQVTAPNPATTPGGGADSLFAAIGMPPPPFSAKKR